MPIDDKERDRSSKILNIMKSVAVRGEIVHKLYRLHSVVYKILDY
jgi:hypothetical protein